MKRFLLAALLLSCSLTSSFNALAQKKRQQATLSMGPTFGIKGGIGSSSLAGTIEKSGSPGIGPSMTKTTLSSKIGVVIGGLFNYRFTPQLSIQAEALYAGRGFIAKSANPLGDRRDYNASLQYVEVPLMGKLNANIFFLEAGVVPSLLVAATFDKDATPANGTKTTEKGKELTGINSFDGCWALGGGFELTQGGFLSLRYVHGSSSISDKSKPDSELNLKGRSLVNASLQITAGYIFNHSYGRGRRRH